MSNSYILSPKAGQDLREIGIYTVRNWGFGQGEDYILSLQATMKIIANNPNLGRNCDTIRRGYKKYPAKSHVIFYRSIDNGVDIIRILHQRMIPEKHL